MKDLGKFISSCYVTNFPMNIELNELWSICESFRKMDEVYITRKMSKIEKRFMLVRFLGVQDERGS